MKENKNAVIYYKHMLDWQTNHVDLSLVNKRHSSYEVKTFI